MRVPEQGRVVAVELVPLLAAPPTTDSTAIYADPVAGGVRVTLQW